MDYDYIEDWPCWITLFQKGFKYVFLDEVLVKYRVYGRSTSRTSNYNSPYWQTYEKMFFKMRLKLLIKNRYFKVMIKEFLRLSYILFLKIMSRFHK